MAAQEPDGQAKLESAVANIYRAASKHVVKKETARRYVSRLMRAAAMKTAAKQG